MRIAPIHEFLLSDPEEVGNDEIHVDACRNRDVDHAKDDGEDLLHLLHLRIGLCGRGVASVELAHLDVLQSDRNQNQRDVGDF